MTATLTQDLFAGQQRFPTCDGFPTFTHPDAINGFLDLQDFTECDIMRIFAGKVAQAICDNSTLITDVSVSLCGAVARGTGSFESNFKLVVSVDYITAGDWLLEVNRQLLDSDVTNASEVATIRRDAALKILGIVPDTLVNIPGLPCAIPASRLDMYMLHHGWDYRTLVLYRIGELMDEEFMNKLSADAVPYSPQSGFRFAR